VYAYRIMPPEAAGPILPDHQRSQDDLVTFLNTELDLCHTLARTAELSSSRDHEEQALGNIRRAIDTVRGMMDRVEDPQISQSIHERVDDAEKLLGRIS
jgi:hypothetical protein